MTWVTASHKIKNDTGVVQKWWKCAKGMTSICYTHKPCFWSWVPFWPPHEYSLGLIPDELGDTDRFELPNCADYRSTNVNTDMLYVQQTGHTQCMHLVYVCVCVLAAEAISAAVWANTKSISCSHIKDITGRQRQRWRRSATRAKISPKYFPSARAGRLRECISIVLAL